MISKMKAVDAARKRKWKTAKAEKGVKLAGGK
jgi:hypothetical protein